MSKTALHTRKIVISAVFLSIALVLRTWFSIDIPLFGANGIRVGIHSAFSIMPALFFGPFYGAAVAGLADFLGFQLRPTGTFIPWLTLSATAAGFLRGGLWTLLRDRNAKQIHIGLVAFSVLLIGMGAFNLFVRNDYITFAYDPMTIGLIGGGALGLLLLVLEWGLSKVLKDSHGMIAPLLLTLMIAGLAHNTVNTEILRRMLFPPGVTFASLWGPRIVVAIVTTSVHVYIVAFLWGVFERQPNLRAMVGLERKQ
jgi:ECF transporter S component (folate family)